jgi:hypothetical protein
MAIMWGDDENMLIMWNDGVQKKGLLHHSRAFWLYAAPE